MFANKSFLTNLVAAMFIGAAYLFPSQKGLLANIGFFALSGSITNWIAIQMLFEKVPGLYGSGIIPNKFEEFKLGIRKLMMGEFFTKENIERFFMDQSEKDFDLTPMFALIDYDLLFQKLKDGVMNSPLGGMLGMFGGPEVLDQMKEPMIHKVREAVSEMIANPTFKSKIQTTLQASFHIDEMLDKVEHVVQSRLDELTPLMVKDIIQEMIREHLGWLVVWGGFFGGLMGIIAYFFKYL